MKFRAERTILKELELSCDGWNSGPLLYAQSFWERWKGLRPRIRTHGLFLSASMVHGIGMEHPLGVVGVDRSGRVVQTGQLFPRRMLWFRGSAWMIELAPDHPLPPPGAVLQLSRPTTAPVSDTANQT